jgi:glutamate synthase (NADPH/NADH) small chain
MSWEEIKLQVGDEVKKLLEERHISEEEVKKVIDFAETKGEKLYQQEANRYLAKSRLGEVTIYVEYSTDENGYIVHTAYSHRSKIGKE